MICLETNFNIGLRRGDSRGFWGSKRDAVPVDEDALRERLDIHLPRDVFVVDLRPEFPGLRGTERQVVGVAGPRDLEADIAFVVEPDAVLRGVDVDAFPRRIPDFWRAAQPAVSRRPARAQPALLCRLSLELALCLSAETDTRQPHGRHHRGSYGQCQEDSFPTERRPVRHS